MQPQDNTASINQQQEISQKNLPHVIRVKHDTENPFVMLNKQTMRDTNLSLEAVGLWARLLCNKDDWMIHVTQLMKANNCGRDKMYRILRELVKNGYAYHACERINGKYQTGVWYVFETKKTEEEIKKMFPFTENPYTEKPNTENPPLMIPNVNETKRNDIIDAPSKDDAKKSSSSSHSQKKIPFKSAVSIERMLNHPQREAFFKAFQKHLVGMTEDQYQALVTRYGLENTTKMCEYLAEWKLSKAQASPSDVNKHADYYRITKWVKKEVLENQSSAPGAYKRTGKLAIESDKKAMAELKAKGTQDMTADELGKKILENEPTLVDDYFKKYYPEDKQIKGDK